MDKEELNKNLDRLDEIINEARDIINSLELAKRDIISEQYNVPIGSIKLESNSITTRLLNVCNNALNITTVGELLRITPRQLACYRGMGSTCIAQIQEYFKKTYGVDWV